MTNSLLTIELQEDAFEINKEIVQKWMKKVPDSKYGMVSCNIGYFCLSDSYYCLYLML